MKGVYRTVQEISFALDDIPARPEPKRIMMCPPNYYDVVTADNHYMEKHRGTVNKERAVQQWKQLKEHYRSLGCDVAIVPEQPDLPDMTFTANHGISLLRNGKREIILSKMKNPNRQQELKFFDVWYRLNKYLVHHCSPAVTMFEGAGDAIWHPGKLLLWGGWGFRTDPAVYEEISAKWEIPIMALQLIDKRFYHLDTCFCPLTADTTIVFRNALTDDGFALIKKYFTSIIEPSEEEAVNLLACNAHSPDGKTVIIQKGCDGVIQQLRERGFSVIETETSEFLKSGGSVYCLKMMVY